LGWIDGRCAAHAREKVGPGGKVPGTIDEGGCVTKDIKWLGWGALLEVDSLVEKGKESILLVYWEVGEWHQFSG
jgi:hypothetical protein